jgi:hypothetical protein
MPTLAKLHQSRNNLVVSNFLALCFLVRVRPQIKWKPTEKKKTDLATLSQSSKTKKDLHVAIQRPQIMLLILFLSTFVLNSTKCWNGRKTFFLQNCSQCTYAFKEYFFKCLFPSATVNRLEIWKKVRKQDNRGLTRNK